jgi:cardiolipin synthase (CMP-forming)
VFSLPNILTWLRILAIPLMVLVYWLPPSILNIGMQLRNDIACGLFVAAAVTDWFDGYLARRLNQMSPFGAFLDPVADKLLVCAALLVLLDMDRVNSILALIIIGREITISALREWMAELGARSKVAVSALGKYKTGFQMAAIPMLLYDKSWFDGLINWPLLGRWLLWVAAGLTVWSMLVYLKQALPLMRGKQ